MAKKEISLEAIEKFLDGHNDQQRIVNLDYKYDWDYIKVFYRDENDSRCVEECPFFPFVWAKLTVCTKLCNGNRNELKTLMSRYGIGVKELDVTNLQGEQCDEMLDGYRYLFYAKRKMSYSDFLDFFKKTGYPIYSKDDSQKGSKYYLCVTPQEQFLISTGKRFFKGYEDYNELLRMIFDLETEGLDPTRHRIKLNGIRLNRPVQIKDRYFENFNKIFRVKGETEAEKNASELNVIEIMLKAIKYFKPDIITAHNGENFDWNFIIERCKALGTDIETLSRKYFNGEVIFKSKRESILKLGGEIEKFHQTVVPTIITTDSLHAVRRAQALDSNMKEANLKYVTIYSEMVKQNRVYVPGEFIDKTLVDTEKHFAFNNENGDWYMVDKNCGKEFVFDGNTKRKNIPVFNNVAEGYELVTGEYIVERYLYDDLWECDKVEHRYNTPNFLICKMLPVPFQKCCTMGTAGQWKALLLAWSYENNLAIPPFSERKSFTGGLSRLLYVGFVDKVAKFDYNSLYPSIDLTWHVSDEKDLMESMLAFLEHVLTQREKYKKLKKKAGKEAEKIKEKLQNHEYVTKEEGKKLNAEMLRLKGEESFNDKKQLPLKILGNSFFGSYGAPNVFPWGSTECAERTTCIGRQCLRLMIYYFNSHGYKPIVGDTDGFNFQLPDDSLYRYTDENPYISTGLSRETEKGKKYTGFKADVAEFNDLYMCDKHYHPLAVNKMGLGIDEIVDATINFSRKNYADYFPNEPYPKDVKMVGNTIKSKKMPEYIAKFLDKGVRLLLQNKGSEFLTEYYNYIEKIYNYQIPIRQIASKGKIKKTIEEYKVDCQTLTKAGNKKSRQAWMELAINNDLKVDLGQTLYYINTGTKKADADVKKITHYYKTDGDTGERVEITKDIEKAWRLYQKENKDKIKSATKGYYLTKNELIQGEYPLAVCEDEIILNTVLVPADIIDNESDVLCKDGEEYNVPKYIEQFNKRITPLLVCFSKDIRDKILIDNPSDRKFFTEEESKLCSGQPNKDGDQDSYEQIMTMEDKEIKFWLRHPEWEIPFLKECNMDWEKIKSDYIERIEKEKQLGIDKVREQFDSIINNLKPEDLDEIEDGVLPSAIEKLVVLDPKTSRLMSKEFDDVVIATIYDLFDLREYLINKKVEEIEQESAVTEQ